MFVIQFSRSEFGEIGNGLINNLLICLLHIVMILWEEIMFRLVVGQLISMRFSCNGKIRGLATRVFDHMSYKILPVDSSSLF